MRVLLVALGLMAFAACGQSAPAARNQPPAGQTQSGIEIRDAWVSPTPGGVDVSAGYLTVANRDGEADRLVAASSPRAARVELHVMNMDGAVMQMRRVEGLDVPAGGELRFAPGGAHLMFIGVAQPFVAGEQVSLTLTFARGGDRTVALPVGEPPRP